ncbi:DUF1810 domain-containing protein [Noviherbaspirillum galbum]|nr:DUF1810 domain-containing protein [Noviherbaspirillum galbum]
MTSHRLDRFLTAQDAVIDQVRAELRAGRKRSHWMWFIFPQVAGLGHSAMARAYAIASLDEARAYLDHPVLGGRLRECAQLVLDLDGETADSIFGSPDNLKFHSSMTLFAIADGADESVFAACLAKYFSGRKDAGTLSLLGP